MSVFSNLPSDSILPDIGMSDPNNSLAPNQSAGGQTKVNKTDMSGLPSVDGYGYMSPDLKDVGQASGNGSGALTDNTGTGDSSGIPAAQPIDPPTYGNVNNSAGDFPGNASGKL